MGYYCDKEIASVVEPSEIVLANNPNFVVFSSTKKNPDKDYFTATIDVVRVGHKDSNLSIEIVEKQSGKTHTFRSTYDKSKINDDTFFVVSSHSHLEGMEIGFQEGLPLVLTAQNIKNCLLKNSFLRNNFEITVNVSKVTTEAVTLDKSLFEDSSITIKAKGVGPQYDFTIKTKYDDIEAVESDYLISLDNLIYSNLDLSNFRLVLNGQLFNV